MIRREPPSVLVVASERADGRRIASMLEETGIRVTTVPDDAAAMAAVKRRRLDLAIVTPRLPAEPGRIAAAEGTPTRLPGIEVLVLDETGPIGDPRRFVGTVRERLLCVGLPPDPPDPPDAAPEAELCIASAKLACLRRRRDAAGTAGMHRLVGELRRAIDATAADCRELLWSAAQPASVGVAGG